jgi:hypothetical protein
MTAFKKNDGIATRNKAKRRDQACKAGANNAYLRELRLIDLCIAEVSNRHSLVRGRSHGSKAVRWSEELIGG